MESNLVVMKRFTLQAQRGLQEKHNERVGELGDLFSEMIMAGKKKRNDMEEEDASDCCGMMDTMTMMIPAPIPAFTPYQAPSTPATSVVPPIGSIGPVVGNGINKKKEVISQMTRMLCVDTTRGDYFQQHYRRQSTTTTTTTISGTTTTKVTTELTSNTIKSLEQQQGHHHAHHLHHHHHHHHEPLVHHSGGSSSASSVSSASFASFEDGDILSSAPTTPVNEKASLDFPIVFGHIEEEEIEEPESNELLLPVAATATAIASANAIPSLPSTKISAPPKPTVEEVTDDESDNKRLLQVWPDHKEDGAVGLGDVDDSEESNEEELEEETDSGEEDDDEEEDDSDDEVDGWETEDEEGGHHRVQFTHQVSEISMGGFVFGYSDDEDEEETDLEDDEFEDEEEDEDDADCPNDGLFGYDSADDSDDEEVSEEEEEDDHIPVTFVDDSMPHPMRRINSHRMFDRPPLRPCLSSVSMKREESNCSSSSNSGGSRVRFSETAERPQIIKTTHFRYSYYEFETHLKSPTCDKKLKSTFEDNRTEMEKFQELNFLRESYISLLDDDDAARERENPSNSIVGKVEHILLSKAMESRGEDCTLEDIGLGFGNKASFCMETLFTLIGGKIKLSEFDKKEHAKGNEAPPSTPVASPDASGDEWETDCHDEDEDEE